MEEIISFLWPSRNANLQHFMRSQSLRGNDIFLLIIRPVKTMIKSHIEVKTLEGVTISFKSGSPVGKINLASELFEPSEQSESPDMSMQLL